MKRRPRLILLLFGGIPNSPCGSHMSFCSDASSVLRGGEDN
jgi:hypothetical protein